jgi:pimeloyl-ACP methyl ester carboxylesterase
MGAQVAIIHGWSDSSKSFANLKAFLSGNGYAAAQIWLGDYVSLDDDVRVEDVAKRMQAVLLELVGDGRLQVPFDLIVHSTGGLVAREWVSTFYPRGQGCPAKRIIMLAPANFGSRLAALGKSMVGRLTKGFNNWFQTGEQMLKGLELASRYQWRLACRDMLDPDEDGGLGPYGHDRIWPFVIAGTRGYSDGLRTIVNEHGSDSTVRPAAANLNVRGITVDFARDPATPLVRPWRSRMGATAVPFAVLPDRDHGTILHPAADVDADPGTSARLGQLILQALRCDSNAAYDAIGATWAQISEDAGALAGNSALVKRTFRDDVPDTESFHQYLQFVVRARDDHGQAVDDFFLEFFAPGTKGDRDVIFFHKEVLEHVHTNTVHPSYRCLFIDRTDLIGRFYPLVGPDKRKLAMSVSAAKIGPNVRYFDSTREGARGHVVLHDADEQRRDALPARLHRNTTHLIDLILPRQPLKQVFKLSQ